MEEMSILEFLAFEDMPKEVKLALKNIYFNVQFVPKLASGNLLQASIYVLLS